MHNSCNIITYITYFLHGKWGEFKFQFDTTHVGRYGVSELLSKKKSIHLMNLLPNSLHNCHKQTELAIPFPLTTSKHIPLALCQQQNSPTHPHSLSLFSCSHHRSQNCLRTFIWSKYFRPKTNICPLFRPAPPFPFQVATRYHFITHTEGGGKCFINT